MVMEVRKDTTPELSRKAKSFKPGIYQHYKRDLYYAFFVARHSEARNEEFVVYRSMKKGFIWVRPLKMFLERIEVNGKKVARFKSI